VGWFAERAAERAAGSLRERLRERETLKALESCCDDKEQSSNQIYEQPTRKMFTKKWSFMNIYKITLVFFLSFVLFFHE